MSDRPNMHDPKSAWRRWARSERARLDRSAIARHLTDALREWLPYRSARHVLTYMAFGDELDLGELVSRDGKAFYVTRTPPGAPGVLTIHRLEETDLEEHAFGFLQPSATALAVAPDHIDLALVPGLAFDRSGTRLGYGRGYYDRLLVSLPPGTPLVGVAPSRLLVPRLPAESHDVPMAHLATEEGVLPAAGD